MICQIFPQSGIIKNNNLYHWEPTERILSHLYHNPMLSPAAMASIYLYLLLKMVQTLFRQFISISSFNFNCVTYAFELGIFALNAMKMCKND